jgi:2-methylcitrate dehydratase PrpD
MSAAATLARFCRALSWADQPESVRRRTLELVLDHVGVAVRGSLAPSSLAVRSYVRRMPGGAATVIGDAATTAAPWAALANGTAAHALELDDVERASVLHPGAPVIPAALAMAEEHDASAETFLAAVICGYEVTLRVGAALNPGNAYRRGFHPTGVAGAFGAAAAAGRVLELDDTKLAHAFGIVGSMASGSLAYLADGAWTKRVNAGWAASAGCVAAGLAEAGFTGPAGVLEGPLGTLHAYSDDARPELLLQGLGGELGIMRVAIKPYGCCRWAHALVDCMFELRRNAFRPEDVERIRLGVLTIGSLLIAEPIEQKRAPRTIVDAQFSAPFAAAVALVTGSAGFERFSDANLADPVIRGLMARSECYRDGAMDDLFPARMPGRVEIDLKDGRRLEARTDYPRGEPENPLSEGDLLARFEELAGPVLGERSARGLARRLLSLDRERGLGAIGAALRSGEPAVATASALGAQ